MDVSQTPSRVVAIVSSDISPTGASGGATARAIDRRKRRAAVASRDMKGLSEAFRWAYNTTRQDDGSAWTFEALAAAVQRLGTPVSAIYYRQIYNGREPGVHAQLLANTADALGLPTNYFTDAVVRRATIESLTSPSAANEKLMALVKEFRSMTHEQQTKVLNLLSEPDS